MKICIPSINTTINKDNIFKVFANLKIGRIGRILENPHYKNPAKKRIIIYVEFNESPKAKYMKTLLEKDQPVFLVYDQPWFWKIVKCK